MRMLLVKIILILKLKLLKAFEMFSIFEIFVEKYFKLSLKMNKKYSKMNKRQTIFLKIVDICAKLIKVGQRFYLPTPRNRFKFECGYALENVPPSQMEFIENLLN